MSKTRQETLSDAMQVLRADYFKDVEEIGEEIKNQLKAGDIPDRDRFLEAVDEATADDGRVIYTQQAMLCLVFSENADAFFEEFGEIPKAGNSVNWSAIACMAFRRDVLDWLAHNGVEANDPFTCPDCTNTFDTLDAAKECCKENAA